MRTRWRLPSLFGPIFAYDLVASTRRGQHTGLRVLVAVLLLFTLYVVYTLNVSGFDPFGNPFAEHARINPKQMANFADYFAKGCLTVQFAAVILLTPTIVADAIARDKERRALDFLFVTDLTDREIIFGKLASRLVYLVGVLLTGVPILSLTLFFGGVSPEWLFLGYASVFGTLASLGALSLYCSVVSATALQATMRAYAAAFGYLLVCPCMLFPIAASEVAIPGMIVYVLINFVFGAVLVAISIHDLRPRANLVPLVPVLEFTTIDSPRPRKKRPLPPMVIPVAEIVPMASDHDAELPFVLPVQDSEPPVKLDSSLATSADRGWGPAVWRGLDSPVVWEPPELPRFSLPPVSDDHPLLWKEVHLHSVAGGVAVRPIVQTMIILAGALTLVFFAAIALNTYSGPTLREAANGHVRIGFVTLGSLACLGAIMHAANSITREREKDTLDMLLVLPASRAEILEAKWFGGIVSLRLVLYALLLVYVFGLLTGALHPLGAAAVALSMIATLEFLTSLGLLISILSRTSLRANLTAALCLLLVGFGPYIVANYAEWLAGFGYRVPKTQTLTDSLMPLVAWFKQSVTWSEYNKLPNHFFLPFLYASLGYAVAAWGLWRLSLWQFHKYGGKRP